jgi:hypothetical protein
VPDLIFQGWSGGEADFVQIHLSNKDDYEKPLTFYQKLKEIKVENGFIKELIVLDFGCCAEYVEHERKYFFDKNTMPVLQFERARIKALDKKYRILNTPIYFEVQNDGYKLRGAPKVDDTSTFVYDFHKQGNTMTTFNKGDVGYAWVINKNDPEREWWYVEMMPVNRKIENEMFYVKAPLTYRRIGWMSSKYLKRIK